MVDRLVAGGLVQRSHSPTDGRSVLVSLTAKGAALLEHLAAQHVKELLKQEPLLAESLRAVETNRPGAWRGRIAGAETREDAMIEVLPQSHDAVVGVRATGLLTDADYKQTLIPLLEKTIAARGRARLLVEIADTFAGWEMAAAWDDAHSVSPIAPISTRSRWSAGRSGSFGPPSCLRRSSPER